MEANQHSATYCQLRERILTILQRLKHSDLDPKNVSSFWPLRCIVAGHESEEHLLVLLEALSREAHRFGRFSPDLHIYQYDNFRNTRRVRGAKTDLPPGIEMRIDSKRPNSNVNWDPVMLTDALCQMYLDLLAGPWHRLPKPIGNLDAIHWGHCLHADQKSYPIYICRSSKSNHGVSRTDTILWCVWRMLTDSPVRYVAENPTFRALGNYDEPYVGTFLQVLDPKAFAAMFPEIVLPADSGSTPAC